jgi:cellobiose transport system substrate-binding protein
MTSAQSLRAWLGVGAALALGLAGCAGPSGGVGGPVMTITIADFGDFRYQPLFAEYEKQHPNIRLQERVSDFDTHHRQLATELAAGHGAADIEAVEEQYMPQFRQSTGKFVNLADYGAKNLENQWTPWKWAQGVTDGGGFVMGLGTDMGGLAMCYRHDLFAQAGLPTDRDTVGKLWPTWEAFANVADRFSAAVHTAKFGDSALSIYTAILNQAPENYFSAANDSFIADRNPNVRRAFDIAGSMGAKEETAKFTQGTQAWSVGVKQGSFATVECPAWMLAEIKDAGGPEGSGKWDVATIPGDSGNQGGSFLTIPKQSQHVKEAYDVTAWLTAPAQEKRIFLASAVLPSEPAAYRDRQVMSATDPYFNNAPIGQIFAGSADDLRPNYRGTKHSVMSTIFGNALGSLEDRSQSVDSVWNQAVQQAHAALN